MKKQVEAAYKNLEKRSEAEKKSLEDKLRTKERDLKSSKKKVMGLTVNDA